MSLPLLRKEAREHGPVLAATAVIGLVALFTILGVAEDAGGRFVGLARFLLMLGPLIALVLANRLLVREYTGRTQFFLETLPIGRVVGPADVAALAVHIMTNTALTGATYDVDGGQQLVAG